MIFRTSKKLLFIVVTMCFFLSCSKEEIDEYASIYNVNFTNTANTSYHIRLTPQVLYLYWDGNIRSVFTYTIKDGVIFTEKPNTEDYLILSIDLNKKELTVLKTNMNWLQDEIFKQ